MELKRIRERAGFTRQQLADALNVSQYTVRSWELNSRDFTLSTAIAICNTLDCTLDELAGIDDREQQKSSVSTDGLTPENKKLAYAYISGLRDAQ